MKVKKNEKNVMIYKIKLHLWKLKLVNLKKNDKITPFNSFKYK